MIHPRHFLVAIDFSTSADRALTYAITLGKQLQAHLTLLHVIYLPRMIDVDLSTYHEQLEGHANQAMEGCLQRVLDARLEADRVVLHGVPFREIVKHAAETHADLIVMGRHGRTGLPHAFLGSVAERVVRLAPCAVLVAPPPAEMSTA